MNDHVTQRMVQVFAARHVYGLANWVVDAIHAVQSGDAPDWVPFDFFAVESVLDGMRIATASIDKPKPDKPYQVVGHAHALAILAAREIPADFEGAVTAAREHAEALDDAESDAADRRDEYGEDEPEHDAWDFAADLLRDYASALNRAADDAEQPEVFQVFMVSDWLAHNIEGEGILRDANGCAYWLRTCCGQSVSMDGCIEAAARLWYGASGAREWTRYDYALSEAGAGRRLLDAARAFILDSSASAATMSALHAAVADIEAAAFPPESVT